MIRNIASFPCHKTLKHAAIFVNMNKKFVEKWKESPVKYAYNPLVPGASKHVWDTLSGGMVDDSDKKAWDFNFLEWIVKVLVLVMVGLSDRPEEWTEEQYVSFVDDAKKAIYEVFTDNVYVTSDGTQFKVNLVGIMKSGWFNTISGNSLGQVICHVMSLMMMGYSAEEIQRDFVFMAGGDDVLQRFPKNFDREKYFSMMKNLGIVVTERKTHASMEGVEFFSNKFTKKDGVVQTIPVRFSKHVLTLLYTDEKNLAQTIQSHLTNYCFSSRHFTWFAKLWNLKAKERPDLFKDWTLPTRDSIRFRVLGMSS